MIKHVQSCNTGELVDDNLGGDCANHTPKPVAYKARHEWADEMMKTHVQTRCKGCGKWKVWIPKDTKVQDQSNEEWLDEYSNHRPFDAPRERV